FVSCSQIHREKGHKLYRAARGMAFAGSVYKGLARRRRSRSACAADLLREDAAWTHPDLQMERQHRRRSPRCVWNCTIERPAMVTEKLCPRAASFGDGYRAAEGESRQPKILYRR